MRIAELFAGIGGVSLAVRGAGDVAVYCDISTESQAALRSLMERGLIDRAPIHDDVRTLKLDGVDLITGGFPCQGNSSFGKRKGLEDPRSGLIREVFRLVEESRPALVFLENVKEVLQPQNGTVNFMVERFRELGYALAWTLVSAREMGLEHKRNRFFALAVRDGTPAATLQEALAGSQTYALQGRGKEPPRMVLDGVKAEHLRRAGLYGNAVCPPAVKYAFEALLRVHLRGPGALAKPREKHPRLPNRGYADAAGVYEHSEAPENLNGQANVVLLPDAYTPPDGYVGKNSLPRLTQPVHLKLWSTPRHGAPAASQVLTGRTKSDLGTQMRFDHRTPDDARGGTPNADFVRYLMGYPPEWV